MNPAMFLPASRSLQNLDELKAQGQGIKDWLAEDSMSKSALVNTLALAGPKGYLAAKGIEVASLAAKHLGGDRAEVTGAYIEAAEDEKSTLGRMKVMDVIVHAEHGISSRYIGANKDMPTP